MVVPTLATIVVGVNGLVGHMDTVELADRARTFANLNSEAGALSHELQEERAKAVMALGWATMSVGAITLMATLRFSLSW